MAFEKELGKRLRFVRGIRELSQSSLARAAKLQPSAIAHIESGRRMPTARTLRAICKAAMVSADYLLGISERTHP